MAASTQSTTSGFQQIRSADAETQLKAAEDISYAGLVKEVRDYFDSGKTKNVEWRKQQLRQMLKLFQENHEEITAAIAQDHGGSKIRGLFDMLGTLRDLDLFLKKLDEWTAPEKVKHSEWLGKSYLRKEPKGVVLVIAPWNFPVAMVFDLLVPIIGGGNCCIIKPSEVSGCSCEVIANLIPKYLDTNAIKVVTGGVPETTALLREKFDHIAYTGNGAIARVVMTAAAKHLTPVTLELGGKSPTYIDASAKLDAAVNRISQSKWINAGQICIAPDYILVHEKYAEEFKKKMVEKVHKLFGKSSEERQGAKAWGKIINPNHVSRVERLLKESSGQVLVGGERDHDERFHEPTLVSEPDVNDPILREEIFGPLLPIITVKNVDEAIEKVNKICKDPLALYVFAEDQKVIDYFLDHTNSGGVCVNTTLEHNSNESLPFGGFGESGMGKYHGKWGFDEFTHTRGVFVKDTFFSTKASFPEPPHHQDEKLYNIMVKLFITGFLTESQKTLLKAALAAAVAGAGYYLVKSKL